MLLVGAHWQALACGLSLQACCLGLQHRAGARCSIRAAMGRSQPTLIVSSKDCKGVDWNKCT